MLCGFASATIQHSTAEYWFFTYHGMTAEQVLWAWFKSEILCPKRLVFKSDSYYYEAMQPAIRAGMKRKRGKPMKKSEDNA